MDYMWKFGYCCLLDKVNSQKSLVIVEKICQIIKSSKSKSDILSIIMLIQSKSYVTRIKCQ